jgi:hypothetical protein
MAASTYEVWKSQRLKALAGNKRVIPVEQTTRLRVVMICYKYKGSILNESPFSRKVPVK